MGRWHKLVCTVGTTCGLLMDHPTEAGMGTAASSSKGLMSGVTSYHTICHARKLTLSKWKKATDVSKFLLPYSARVVTTEQNASFHNDVFTTSSPSREKDVERDDSQTIR